MTHTTETSLSYRTVFLGSLAAFAALTVLTAALTPLLVRFYPLLPDAGPSWYYWQLPSPTWYTRLSHWLGYGVHQLVVWALLLTRDHDRVRGTSVGRRNLSILGVNLLFVCLHLVQTQLFYDGLAQDVPIWTSQGSVIVMLVLILFMMIPRRGLVWGRAFRAPARTLRFVQHWHGLFISWALVYTFWFHPMDGNWGLLSGFVYMFLLFIQLSLFDAPVHRNGTWIVVLEAFVAVHATLITVYKDNPIWPMFLFGFLTMFVLTQVHTWKLPSWAKWTVLGLFLAAIAAVYGFVRGFDHLYEVTFIPVALYGGTIGLLLLGLVVERIARPATAAR